MLSRSSKESKLYVKLLLDFVSVICQASGFFVWPVIIHNRDPNNWIIFVIPISVFLTSMGWWENFVDKNSKIGKFSINIYEKVKNRKIISYSYYS